MSQDHDMALQHGQYSETPSQKKERNENEAHYNQHHRNTKDHLRVLSTPLYKQTKKSRGNGLIPGDI